MSKIRFKIDWFAITVKGVGDMSLEHEAGRYWNLFFEEYLGKLTRLGHGGRGYKTVFTALGGAKVYVNPVNELNHYHIEFPATAVDAMPREVLRGFMRELDYRENREGSGYKVTRLDFAWDYINCSPSDFMAAVQENRIRTLAKRSTLKFDSSPMQEREDGGIGADTCYLGASSSERRIRLYNMHGFNRLEYVMRQDRADAVAREVLKFDVERWGGLAVPHLRDYIDVLAEPESGDLADWWEELIQEVPRAFLTVTDAAEVELLRLQMWIFKQVAPAFSVLVDCMGEGVLENVRFYGSFRDRSRYEHLLKNIKPEDFSPKIEQAIFA
ncbi:MAG: hypothetical protein DWQ07_12295 [Chloroflexi bacterium]|nr:MAG: hypothetical protein DWQ07_12295 [Chloroflexota bacterium]